MERAEGPQLQKTVPLLLLLLLLLGGGNVKSRGFPFTGFVESVKPFNFSRSRTRMRKN